MSRIPEDTIGRSLPGETAPPAPRTRREARERYRTSERRQARGLPSTSTGARSLRQAAKPGASLGAGYLGLGAAILTAIEAVAGIAFFLVRWNEYSDPLLPTVAWVLYIVAAVGVGLSVLTYGERLTGPAFALICVVLACVVTLDFIGIWPEHDIAHTASASMAAGFALLPIATLRPAREVAAAIGVLGIAFVVMAVVSTPITHDTLPGIVSLLSLVVVPPSLALYVVQRFRQLVQREARPGARAEQRAGAAVRRRHARLGRARPARPRRREAARRRRERHRPAAVVRRLELRRRVPRHRAPSAPDRGPP
ncbi:hypothetical protein Q9Q99_04690 [Curtobacterium flaccumfaciens]|nr:hypothetical protein Q9Q99_04690 [Curtobacterium flaccumfaciens]